MKTWFTLTIKLAQAQSRNMSSAQKTNVTKFAVRTVANNQSCLGLARVGGSTVRCDRIG